MRGEVWAAGERPVDGLVGYLVVQADALTEAAPTVITLAVTDRPQRVGPPLAFELSDGAGVWVKTTQLHTLARDRLARRVATASRELMGAVDAALLQVLDLTAARA